MSTRTVLRADLLYRLGNRTELTTTQLDNWLNDGLLDLCTKRIHLRSLETVADPFTTTANDTSAPLPANAFSLMYVEDQTNKFNLYRWPGEWWEYLWARQNASPGPPKYFIEYGGNRFWYPQVDGAYSIVDYFYARPTFGANPGDSPNIETEWHYAIELIAAIHAFRDTGDLERSQSAETEFQAWLAQRDTPTRRTRRMTIPSHGVRPHPSYRNRRTGV
jgi:hypothetical protein